MAFKMGCLVNVIHNYGVHVTMCLGPSMLPTFNRSGDFVLVEQLSVMTDNIRRGDIVIAKNRRRIRGTRCASGSSAEEGMSLPCRRLAASVAHNGSRFPLDTYGFKGITKTTRQTHATTDLFPLACFEARFS